MVHTGKTPRDFNFISSKYLIVGAQDDDEIELFKFNEEKEELIRTAITLAIPSPVCIAVKDKKKNEIWNKGETLPVVIYHVNKGESIICDNVTISWIEPVMEMKTSSDDINLSVFLIKILLI